VTFTVVSPSPSLSREREREFAHIKEEKRENITTVNVLRENNWLEIRKQFKKWQLDTL
jgi:hypothetical protein